VKKAFLPPPPGALGLHPHHSIVTPDVVAEMNARGKWVMPWTANERADMVKLANLGVDALITDYPALAQEVLRS
jgi:glycerophosphoryl diester phosphodiesterase